jgi:hypothetical protein
VLVLDAWFLNGKKSTHGEFIVWLKSTHGEFFVKLAGRVRVS